MNRLLLLAALLLGGLALTTASPVAAGGPAAVGQPAPDFSLKDLDGKAVALKDFAGKTVVLEWFNPGCPFVKYAHGEGPLKSMAEQHRANGVVWLSINSSAPGKEGHGLDTNKAAAAQWNIKNPILLDESGAVGKLYGAKTTPHMYVVDAKGTLAYAGALDNAPMGKPEGGTLLAYTADALADVLAGKAVRTPSTKSYGCSVKYAN